MFRLSSIRFAVFAFLLLLFTFLVLLPLTLFAQSVSPPKIALDVRPILLKQNINFHDEQWSSNYDKARLEFSASAVTSRLHVKYILIPVWSYSETTSVTGPLLVGATDFGTKKDEKDPKTVNLDWKNSGEHRLEFSWTLDKVAVKPLVICEWSNLEVTATSKKDGKDTTDTEQISRFLVAGGGTFHYTSKWIIADISAVAGKDLNRLEAIMQYQVAEHFSINGGYSSETKNLGDSRIRQHGPFFGIALEF